MAGQGGASGQDDVTIDNANTIGDFQTLLRKGFEEREALQLELNNYTQNTEQQLAALRVELRMAQLQPQGVPHAAPDQREHKMELIDMKTMSPSKFSGNKGEHYKAWAKRVKSYCNAKLDGFRQALDAAEKCTSDIHPGTMSGWNWTPAAVADKKLYDLLMCITGE